jgi:hypothetical protein
MNKSYILTVDNLNARILNVAKREANLRGQTLREINNINSYTILLYTCADYSDVINVISTLETIYVISVDNHEEALINFPGMADIKAGRKQPILNLA